jgi:hypothetical protein
VQHVQLHGVAAAVDGVLAGRVPVHLPQPVRHAVHHHAARVAVEPHHDVVAAVDQGRGGGAVAPAEAAAAVGDPGDGVREADGRLQAAVGAGGPLPPDQAPPRWPVAGVAPVAELPVVVFGKRARHRNEVIRR